ncbi:protein-lysine N-methyltransferase EEF2KMT isoform X1 [Rhodamnia argentea]|uniref:Protein-lysine N-methyltransferase EEF2KMT isoform X1 n=1 Tax=Rhodamnia argentea TaxID=178133 RepID=A0A8B8PIY6_9MYRT|nr:protein-lysine N-methyltransferase EEF2KMT isoform X1 [Rhodamnia argentea]
MEKQTASLHLVSAFLAMEPTDCVLSHARSLGGGSVTVDVQRFVWDHCISKAIGKCHAPYLKHFLKKLILEIEANRDDVLDELYELYTEFMTSLKDENAVKGNVRALKYISFIFPDDASCKDAMVRKLVVPLHCSLNMLEGDTGCSIWPASLFLSEFILSFPDMFSGKTCFEVGSGVGLVGICLSHVKASKVILSDGDLSTLSNMKLNLKMNQLSTSDDEPESSQCPDSFEPAQIGGIRTEIDIVSSHQVKCLHLPWECASEIELQGSEPDIILGADVIYDPLCLPHLVHLLSILVDKSKSSQFPRAGCDSAIGNSHDYSNRCNSQDVEAARDRAGNASPTKHPIAYISSVIRNANTFDRFLALVDKANLTVADLTGTFQPASLLPYMQSYDRSSIRLFRLSSK